MDVVLSTLASGARPILLIIAAIAVVIVLQLCVRFTKRD